MRARSLAWLKYNEKQGNPIWKIIIITSYFEYCEPRVSDVTGVAATDFQMTL